MLRYFFAYILSFLVLLSSTGYSITAHLCHGKAVNYSLLGQPVGCGTEEENAPDEHCRHEPAPDQSCQHLEPGQCCVNQSQFFKNTSPAVPSAPAPVGCPAVYLAGDGPLLPAVCPYFETALLPPFFSYRPPLCSRDLPVLLQTFRI